MFYVLHKIYVLNHRTPSKCKSSKFVVKEYLEGIKLKGDVTSPPISPKFLIKQNSQTLIS